MVDPLLKNNLSENKGYDNEDDSFAKSWLKKKNTYHMRLFSEGEETDTSSKSKENARILKEDDLNLSKLTIRSSSEDKQNLKGLKLEDFYHTPETKTANISEQLLSTFTPKNKTIDRKIKFISGNNVTNGIKNSEKLYNKIYKSEQMNFEYRLKPLNQIKVLIIKSRDI